MIKKGLLSIVTVVVLSSILYSQETKTKRYPSIVLGGGVLTFGGDIGTKPYTKRRAGMSIGIEQPIAKLFSISLSGTMGKLADSEISKTRNLNFESNITQADLNFIFNMRADTNTFVPFLSAGVGYLMFKSHGDLTDENGIAYYYWQDGTIRDLPESPANENTSQRLKRDYTYETLLTDSTTSYSRSSLSIPLSLGLNTKLLEKLHVKVGATYYMALTDWIDNVKDGGNDNYIYVNVGVKYRFGKKTDINEGDKRSTTEFNDLDKIDADADGIVDTEDKCLGTPTGVKTTSDGCPVDTDEDGVPDYKDEEADTKKGAVVNSKGVTQTEEMIAARQKEFDESASVRLNTFVENPSEAKKVESARGPNTKPTVVIPETLKSADGNKDGIISTDEIGKSIDSFFDGESDFTVEKLNDLIDLFFEQ